MNAITVLAQATMTAAVHQLATKRIEVNADALADALRKVLKANIATVMEEWKAATTAYLSEAWLRKLLNAQAHDLALEAIGSLKGKQ